MKMNFNSHNSYISKISKHFEQMQNRNQRTPTKSTRSSPQPPIIQKTVNHEISPPPSNKHSHYPHPRTPIKLIHTRPTFTPPRSVDPFLSAVRATLSTVGSSRLSSIRARSHQRGRLERTARLSAATATTTAALHHHHHHSRRRLHHHSERAAEEPKRRRAPRFLRSESVGRNEPRALGLSVFVPSLRVATRLVACTALPVRCAGIEWNTRIAHRSVELTVSGTKVTEVDSFRERGERLPRCLEGKRLEEG